MRGRRLRLKGVNMKKAIQTSGLRREYDFRGGKRGKYAARYAKGTNVVMLDDDVAAVFRDAKAVNRALRACAEIAKATTRIA